MNSIRKAYLKSFDPAYSIKISSIDKDTIPITLVKEIHKFLSYKHTRKLYVDEENGVIYIGKK